MFDRILALRNLGIKLIFVTEGEAPELKQNTMKKRNEARYFDFIQIKLIPEHIDITSAIFESRPPTSNKIYFNQYCNINRFYDIKFTSSIIDIIQSVFIYTIMDTTNRTIIAYKRK